jgi:hypothetical protein
MTWAPLASRRIDMGWAHDTSHLGLKKPDGTTIASHASPPYGPDRLAHISWHDHLGSHTHTYPLHAKCMPFGWHLCQPRLPSSSEVSVMLMFVRKNINCIAARPGFDKFLGPALPIKVVEKTNETRSLYVPPAHISINLDAYKFYTI